MYKSDMMLNIEPSNLWRLERAVLLILKGVTTFSNPFLWRLGMQ